MLYLFKYTNGPKRRCFYNAGPLFSYGFLHKDVLAQSMGRTNALAESMDTFLPFDRCRNTALPNAIISSRPPVYKLHSDYPASIINGHR
jgi:hypothetical protein